MPADPLQDVLDLEDRFYQRGYAQGLANGAHAGRIDGRATGLRTGFDKFVAAGRLAARAAVWANRLPRDGGPGDGAGKDGEPGDGARPARGACALPPLPAHACLERNVRAVYAFVEPATLNTRNADAAVDDFDDRLRRAQGKARVRVVERMVG